MSEDKFTWRNAYAEIAKKIIDYRDRQTELIAILAKMTEDLKNVPIIKIDDREEQNGKPVRLKSIDPFTFFSNFNRNITNEHKSAIIRYTLSALGLNDISVPKDFLGIPTVDNNSSWFFAYKYDRKNNDIDNLWSLATAIINNEDESVEKKFNDCLTIKQVGVTYLTIGCFWLSPDKYLSLDVKNREYCRTQYNIEGPSPEKTKCNYNAYREFLTKIMEASPSVKFQEISHNAHLASLESKEPQTQQYWAGGCTWGKAHKSEEFIKNKYWQIGYKKGDRSSKGSRTAWDNYQKVKKGDLIAFHSIGGKYDLIIHFIGTVINKIEDDGKLILSPFKEDGLYKGKGPGMTKGNWLHGTLFPVTGATAIQTIFGININENNMNTSNETSLREPLATIKELLLEKNQIILQGAPGTGKTYISAAAAVAICNPAFNTYEDDETSRKKLMALYSQLVSEGQIAFTSFHQSMDYEEFIEGLRLEKDASCRVSTGTFKEISERALLAMISDKESHTALLSFSDAYAELLRRVKSNKLNKLELRGGKGHVEITEDVSKLNNIYLKHDKGIRQYTVSKDRLEKLFKTYSSKAEFDDIVNINDAFRKVIGGCNSSCYWAVLNYIHVLLIDHAKEIDYDNISIENLNSEEQQEVIRNYIETSQDKRVSKGTPKPYVLIIDEINRGNISKILGELITLLEPDKRIGGINELTATLPYSGSRFGVPKNLYIIGTMNTADRSLGYIDYAIRRRFAFFSMQANKNVIHYENGVKLFEQVHELIKKNIAQEFSVDDLMIGHSYFMCCNESKLERKWQYEIKPLLLEYLADGILQGIAKEKIDTLWNKTFSSTPNTSVTESSTVK